MGGLGIIELLVLLAIPVTIFVLVVRVLWRMGNKKSDE
jgi:hypothetical protein